MPRETGLRCIFDCGWPADDGIYHLCEMVSSPTYRHLELVVFIINSTGAFNTAVMLSTYLVVHNWQFTLADEVEKVVKNVK